MENKTIMGEKLIFLFISILLSSCFNSENNRHRLDKKVDNDKANHIYIAMDSIPDETCVIDSLKSYFQSKGYTITKEIRTDSSYNYFNDFKKHDLYDFINLDSMIDIKFIRRNNENKILSGINSKIIYFNSEDKAYDFIKATNTLLNYEPINFKGPSFYTKKDNVIFIFSVWSFSHLVDVKIMKALCDSLVIQPDTADIRMANECIYNQRMDTYYKTRPWREEMKNY